MDIRTLALVLVITDIIQTAVFLLQYLMNRTYRGIGWWALGFGLVAAGFVAMLMRDIAGIEIIAIFTQNILFISGIIFIYVGCMRFLDKKENRKAIIAISVVFLILFSYFLFVKDDINIRTMVICATIAMISFLNAHGIFINETRNFRFSANFIVAVLFAHAAYYIFRAVSTVTVFPISDMFSSNLAQETLFLVQLIEGIFLTFGLIMMVSQRLIADTREAKEHFELIFNTIPDAVVITRLGDGRIADVNEGFTAITGYNHEETGGKSALDIYANPDDRQIVVNELHRKSSFGNYETTFKRKDGSQFTGSMSARKFDMGGVPHILSITRDITARKQGEEALKASEEKFRTLFEKAPVGIGITSLDGKPLERNLSMAVMYGFKTKEEIMASPVQSRYVHPEERIRYIEGVNKGPVKDFEVESRRLDGSTLWTSHSAQAFVSASGERQIISVVQDITARKNAEEELKRYQEHLEELVKERTSELEKTNSDLKQAIADHRKDEEALKASEEKYRTLVDNIPVGVSIVTTDGRTIERNKAIMAIFGYESKDEAITIPMSETYLDPKDRVHLLELLKKGTVTNFEVQRKRKDGTTFWTSLTSIPDPGDPENKLITVTQDITERKQAEEALIASMGRYRTLVENLPVGVAIVTKDGSSIIDRNKTIMEMLGYRSKEEALADSLKETFYDPKDMDVFIEFSRANSYIKNFEVQSKRKDGTVFLASLTAVPEPGDPENKLIIVTEDITERKEAEAKLAHAASIPQLNPYPVVEINGNGEITFVNSRAEALFPDVNGKDISYPFLSGWEKLLKELAADVNKTIVREINVSGQYYMQSIRYSPTTKGLLFYFTDITALKEAEMALARETEIVSRQARELQKSNAELSAINKELESFSYSVSHDLRTPLRAIDGFSKILLDEYGDKFEGESKDYLNRVRQASQRMGGLIDDLLSLSRVTRAEIHVVPVNLSALADLIVNELRSAHPDRQVDVVIEPGMMAEGDPHLLRIMLTNLLGNAWKFTGKHARAKIEFGKTFRDGQEVFFIRDDGAGFDMAYVDKLFQPFQRLHGLNEFEGTGIGLATVLRVVNRHGGRIWAEGAVEKGATFYFMI